MKSEHIPIITSDGSHTIKSNIYAVTYHSIHGAITEGNHVFIESGLKYYLNKKTKNKIKIFEMGMGTGLNVLLTCLESNKDLNIDYTTVELHPLDIDLISMLNYESEINLAHDHLLKDIHQFKWNDTKSITPHFKLTKLQINLLDYSPTTDFDIVFYDAFGPGTQPELWNYSTMEKIYNMLSPEGVFVTYCAMGQLKRDLRSIGYDVQSIPGPPGKREMIRAIK